MLKALQGRGFLQSLAEPNLIAYNGQEASFLAGGEIPIPLVSGHRPGHRCSTRSSASGSPSRPTIAGDVIRLKLRPEVSTLDFNNGIMLSGFRIPALNTRRAETDVELRDGQSFAIAGLLNNITQTDRQAIPLLSRLPIIGTLFKSRAAARRADRADGAGHAAAGAGARPRRSADAAGAAGRLHQSRPTTRTTPCRAPANPTARA